MVGAGILHMGAHGCITRGPFWGISVDDNMLAQTAGLQCKGKTRCIGRQSTAGVSIASVSQWIARNGISRNPSIHILHEGFAGQGICKSSSTLRAVAMDTNSGITSAPNPPSAWDTFRTSVGDAKQNIQNAVNLNHWVVHDYVQLVKAVNSLETGIRSLSDAELRAKTDEFRKRLKKGDILERLQSHDTEAHYSLLIMDIDWVLVIYGVVFPSIVL